MTFKKLIIIIFCLRITEADDMQSKYERVIAGSLGAWRILLTQIPPQKDMIDSYKSILDKAAFWKLQKHQSDLVRRKTVVITETLINCSY